MGYGTKPMVDLNVNVSLTMKDVVEAFHGVYYSEVDVLAWFGVPVMKCPMDLWAYQEIVCRTQPDCIVETGSGFGGSALFMAMICQLLGRGRVVSVDVKPDERRPVHPLITYITGNSVDDDVVHRVRNQMISVDDRVMVILDSDHSAEHRGTPDGLRRLAPPATQQRRAGGRV